ncbi:MAG: trypsin-like peptidase domain-containing protein [Thaumarchaeota archaeon]|nr:trypsin-like peptidase domain-containing protein [Nitrososphaerota archaeon]MDE1872178.1 trypsin-like peptidase domain-containing protein [Nitrososphaerota archaeon]
MKKLEIALIGVIVVLSATVIAQYTNDRFFGDLSQAAIQGPAGPPGPQGQPGPMGPSGNAGTFSQDSTLTDLFEKTQNSVVQITSKVSTVDNTVIINGEPLSSQSTRLGSGFIYDKEGRIITNNHVVEGSSTVNVTFIDGNTYTAKVVGTDPDNDIAVIQIIDNFSDETLVPLHLGNSSELQVGQQVIAIGNPFGLSDSMTTGIISAIGRLLPNENVGYSIPDIIQVDAAINPGNSGGPLLNLQGEVIGMNTAITTNTGDFSGVGFAIPSYAIERIVPVLIKNGTYQHPYLGIAGRTMDPDVSLANGLPRNFKGVIVEKVVKGGPADMAGIVAATLDDNNIPHGGDIITAIDGHPMKTIDDIIAYLDDEKSVGDKVSITVDRQGKSLDLIVTLEVRPAPSSQ